MKTITIFTPTYNRAYLLPKLYNSLINQSSKDFVWMIIDDGSSDNTKELVQQWQSENKIEILYHYKENGGMHTGHNLAIRLIDTELNVCIDSDDYMPVDAVAKIIDFWNINKSDKYAGILGLDAFEDGRIVSGKKFPPSINSGKYSLLSKNYGLKGDVKFIYRTEVLKKYEEYPVFEGERLTPLGYKYRIIDQDYNMLFLNEVVCIVEYMPDGSSHTIYKQYFQSPKGFKHSRYYTIKYAADFKEKIVQTAHFIKESMITKEYNFFRNNPAKLLSIMVLPIGVSMYFYLKNKIKNNG